jgi:extracellular factor (EF) 3-hydroxypalmitic acid methyl ester biosynthesis protein
MEGIYSQLERQYPKQHREHRLVLPESAEAKFEFSNFYGEKVCATIVNLSEYGVRIELDAGDSLFSLGATLKDCLISIDGKKIFSGRTVIVNEAPSSSGKQTFGIATSEPLDLETVQAILGRATKSHIPATEDVIELATRIKPAFKVLVSDLITFLSDLKYRFSQEDIAIEACPEKQRKTMEEQSITLAMSLFFGQLHSSFKEFQKFVDTLSPEEVAIHKQYFQAIFIPFLVNDSSFSSRALTKPLGYPGDYGLMVMLYEYQDSGETSFHRFWHRYCCTSPAASANKNRVTLLSKLLIQEYRSREGNGTSFKVSTIACGPAKEIELFLSELQESDSGPIEVVCIDQEPQAIDYAQSRIKQLISTKTTRKGTFFVEDAVLGTIRQRPFVKAIQGSQVIISAGLYDYLSDRVATKLITTLYNHLVPGGVLLIGNVSDTNPDVFPMNFLMNWNLVLRNPESLKALVAPEITNNKEVSVEVISEDLGLNLFLRIEKPLNILS